MVPTTNGNVWLCLGKNILSQVLIGPIHNGPVVNDIFLKLMHVQCLILIGAILGYHSLKLDTNPYI